MRICFISKYPPIEGGVSARVYWLAKALGEVGHEIHIVTNANEVEDDYKENLEADDPKFISQNVFYHSTNSETNPWHIPFSPAYSERLANLAVEVIRKYDCQIIDSYYILPYGISGYIAKSLTGKPQILRHAGSDIGKLFASDAYFTLFREILRKVDKIVTIPHLKEMFLSLGIQESALFYDDRVSVDTRAFHSEVAPFPLAEYIHQDIPKCPIITYIGKINYYWQTKGLAELLEAVKDIKSDYRLLFVSNGRGLNAFKKLVLENNLESKTLFLDFVPPWIVPSIIKLSTCVVLPERDFPIPGHMPILPKEVMAVGRCLIMSRELFNKKRYGNLTDGENVLIVDPKNIRQFRSAIEYVIRNPENAEIIGNNAFKIALQQENFAVYIDRNINLYRSLI